MFEFFVQLVHQGEKFLAVRFLAYRMAKVFDVFVEVHTQSPNSRTFVAQAGRLFAILLWGRNKNLTYSRPAEVRHNAPR